MTEFPWVDTEELEEKELFPGLHARIFHTAHQTFVFWRIEEGAVLPAHHHPHSQVALVTHGQLELKIDGDSKVLGPGEVAVIPSNAVHSGRALTACEVTDVFHPVREDLR